MAAAPLRRLHLTFRRLHHRLWTDLDERAVQALLMLVTPGSDQRPEPLAGAAPVVHYYVHTYAGPDAAGISRVESHGAVSGARVVDQ